MKKRSKIHSKSYYDFVKSMHTSIGKKKRRSHFESFAARDTNDYSTDTSNDMDWSPTEQSFDLSDHDPSTYDMDSNDLDTDTDSNVTETPSEYAKEKEERSDSSDSEATDTDSNDYVTKDDSADEEDGEEGTTKGKRKLSNYYVFDSDNEDLNTGYQSDSDSEMSLDAFLKKNKRRRSRDEDPDINNIFKRMRL